MFVKNNTQKLSNYMPKDIQTEKIKSIFNRRLTAKETEINFRNQEDKKIINPNNNSYGNNMKRPKTYADSNIKLNSNREMPKRTPQELNDEINKMNNLNFKWNKL